MPSNLNRRIIRSSDSSRHRTPSGYHDIGAPMQSAPTDASQRRGKSQQNQNQSCHPSVTPQGVMGYGYNPTDSSISPPHTHDNPSFRCPRCGYPFTSQAELDHHSFVCGAAALLIGMLTPYSAQENVRHQRPQLYLQAPRGAGGCLQTQYQNHNQHRRA